MPPARTPALCRAALDQHTECGVPLDRADLRYESADSHQPPTCQKCLRILTIYCARCGAETVRNRILDRTTVKGPCYLLGEPIESLTCACGHIGVGAMQRVGAKETERRLVASRKQAP